MSVRRDRIEIVGVPIDCTNMEGLVARTIEAAHARRFFQIATVNLDFLVRCHRDATIMQTLRSTSINVPDGAPVAWSGRFIGVENIRRVAGADFVPRLMEAAAKDGLRVFFLGGEHDAAHDAAARLAERLPDLEIAVYEPPHASLDDMDHAKILRLIEEADPQILLVAFGHPKQELWIRRHAASLPMVAMGVGCSLDLIAGRQSRAPGWMQRGGLEWAYRLAHEPRRLLRRYATDGAWVVRRLVPWALAERARGTSHAASTVLPTVVDVVPAEAEAAASA